MYRHFVKTQLKLHHLKLSQRIRHQAPKQRPLRENYFKKELRNTLETSTTAAKKKCTYLKFKPARPISETNEFERE